MLKIGQNWGKIANYPQRRSAPLITGNKFEGKAGRSPSSDVNKQFVNAGFF